MSWKESTIMDEKLKFIARHLQGETITELCKEFGVLRTTGHNLIRRYRQMGSEALVAQSRARSVPETFCFRYFVKNVTGGAFIDICY